MYLGYAIPNRHAVTTAAETYMMVLEVNTFSMTAAKNHRSVDIGYIDIGSVDKLRYKLRIALHR